MFEGIEKREFRGCERGCFEGIGARRFKSVRGVDLRGSRRSFS